MKRYRHPNYRDRPSVNAAQLREALDNWSGSIVTSMRVLNGWMWVEVTKKALIDGLNVQKLRNGGSDSTMAVFGLEYKVIGDMQHPALYITPAKHAPEMN